MSLKIEFAIGKTTLLCQESPACKLLITNTGRDPVVLAPPVDNPDVPILRVTELKTGIETLHHGHPPHLGTVYAPLPGEKKIEHEFPFTTVAEILLPANYDVSALVPYDGGLKRAESNTVHIRIIPVTPRDLALAYVYDGWSAVQYGVCVNAASDPPQIVRHQFHIMTGGGVKDARPVANAHLRAAPAISTTPNLDVSHAHWIAWLEDGALAFIHFDAETGSSPTGKWKPSEPEFAIIHPLASESLTQPGVFPPGAALLWVSDAARHLSVFQVVDFKADIKAAPGARWDAGGTRPAWMTNLFPSDGRRLVAYVHDAPAGSATLYLRPWPRPGAPIEPSRLASWPGNCCGGGTLMLDDNTICGATLVRGPKRDGAKLQLIAWKVAPDGRFAEQERRNIPWGYDEPVSRAVIRLGPSGLPAALVANSSGNWSYFNPDGELKPLPAGLANSRLPLDLAFSGAADVVIIAGQVAQGFKVMKDDGEPLPHQEA